MSNEIEQAMVLLNVWAKFVDGDQPIKTLEAAKSHLKDIQAEAKRNYLELAKLNHPDHGGDEEEMKRLNGALDVIMNLKAVAKPRPQRVWRTVIHVQFNSWGSTASTGNTTSSYWDF